MRSVLVFFLVLCATSQASANQQQCTEAVRDANVGGIEKSCAYLRSSPLSYLKAVYHNVLAGAFARKALIDLSTATISCTKAIENYTKALKLLAESEKKSEKIKSVDIRESKTQSHEGRWLLYLQPAESGGVVGQNAKLALQDFSAAISLDPKNATLYLYRGFAHNQLLNTQDAWEDFKQAKALGPNDAAIDRAYEQQRRVSPEGQGRVAQ